MKRILTLAATMLLTILGATAQQTEKFVIHIEEPLSKYLFLYDEWQEGVAEFEKNRNTITANYNAYFQRVQYTDKNEIYAYDVQSTSPLLYITIGEDKWVNDGKKHYRVVREEGGLILAEAISLHTVDQAKDAGYGATSSTSAISTNNAMFNMNAGFMDLRQVSTIELTMERRTNYVIGLNNDFESLSTKNLGKLLPDKKSAIRDFVKKEKIDFTVREDAIRVFEFITQ
ncbi:MAG: hypothetical protein IKM50_01870 [Tidjanibacter sp.]|nr:hypothetical protein [Tidjanibacter sp.]MBR7103174.1 hypothetical protein [Tidjanibacter sp.]